MANFITSNPGIAAADNRNQRLMVQRAEDLRLRREQEAHDQQDADRQAYAAYLGQGQGGVAKSAAASLPVTQQDIPAPTNVYGQGAEPTASAPVDITEIPAPAQVNAPSNVPRQIAHGDVINTGRNTWEDPTSYDNTNAQNLAIQASNALGGNRTAAILNALNNPVDTVSGAVRDWGRGVYDYLTSKPTRPEQTPVRSGASGSWGDSPQTFSTTIQGPSSTTVSPVSASLLSAVINQESGGNPNALSPVGASGIAQIMPDTARDPGYGVKPLQGWDGKDPRTAPIEEQLRFARDYLAAQINNRGGSVAEGLAAYNAGPGAVDRYDGIPPYPETQQYVQNITRASGTLQSQPSYPVQPVQSEPAQQPSQPQAPQPQQVQQTQPQQRQPLSSFVSNGKGSLATMQAAAQQQEAAHLQALTFAGAGHPEEAAAYAKMNGFEIPPEVLQNAQLSQALALGGTAFPGNPEAGQKFIQTFMMTQGSNQDRVIAAMNAAGTVPTTTQRKLMEIIKTTDPAANGMSYNINGAGVASPVATIDGTPIISAVKPNEDPYFKAAVETVQKNIAESGEAMSTEDIVKQATQLASQFRLSQAASAGLGGQTGLQAQASGAMNNLPVVTDQSSFDQIPIGGQFMDQAGNTRVRQN